MPRPPPADKVIIATHNQGKFAEFQTLLAPYVKNLISAAELGLPEPEETGTSFSDNALLKARAAAKLSGRVALADDSGLAVDALDGQPGIFSARWAGPDKDFSQAMQRVQDELGDAENRSARFVCVLALAWPDGHEEIFEGQKGGQIIWPPRGDEGFGYDPFFVPNGHTKTFAEMRPEQKHAISHRALAVKRLLDRFRESAS